MIEVSAKAVTLFHSKLSPTNSPVFCSLKAHTQIAVSNCQPSASRSLPKPGLWHSEPELH